MLRSVSGEERHDKGIFFPDPLVVLAVGSRSRCRRQQEGAFPDAEEVAGRQDVWIGPRHDRQVLQHPDLQESRVRVHRTEGEIGPGPVLELPHASPRRAAAKGWVHVRNGPEQKGVAPVESAQGVGIDRQGAIGLFQQGRGGFGEERPGRFQTKEGIGSAQRRQIGEAQFDGQLERSVQPFLVHGCNCICICICIRICGCLQVCAGVPQVTVELVGGRATVGVHRTKGNRGLDASRHAEEIRNGKPLREDLGGQDRREKLVGSLAGQGLSGLQSIDRHHSSEDGILLRNPRRQSQRERERSLGGFCVCLVRADMVVLVPHVVLVPVKDEYSLQKFQLKVSKKAVDRVVNQVVKEDHQHQRGIDGHCKIVEKVKEVFGAMKQPVLGLHRLHYCSGHGFRLFAAHETTTTRRGYVLLVGIGFHQPIDVREQQLGDFGNKVLAGRRYDRGGGWFGEHAKARIVHRRRHVVPIVVLGGELDKVIEFVVVIVIVFVDAVAATAAIYEIVGAHHDEGLNGGNNQSQSQC
mmetsp:Transcript_32488/g.76465  ORF Transcript_32488/g.76465 Transcript_32488/m.76465 type:complete len:523 (+) Transcript_32488:446-2014(+)